MRTPGILAATALVASTLTAGFVGSAGPALAGPTSFEPRWCSDTAVPVPPCLEAATLNGFDVPKDSAEFRIELTGYLKDDGNRYFQWQVVDLDGPSELSTADEWELTFDTGTIDPLYTEAYAGRPDTARIADGDETFHLVYTAFPVLTAFACEPDGGWPTTCPTVAPDDTVSTRLSGEVHDKAGDEDFRGFDVSQNVDEVNGPFLGTTRSGAQYLEAFMANAHAYDANVGDGVTPVDFEGEVRWRLPYRMLRNWFEIPDPETMVEGSLTGAVLRPDGTPSTADLAFTHDAGRRVWTVDVTGIDFSKKTLRVRTGRITPTLPTQVSATRTAAGKGVVDYEPSTPRGAVVWGHAAKCSAVRGGHVVAGQSTTATGVVRVKGLKAGKKYDCQVAGLSNAGSSRWSNDTGRMGGQPVG